MSPSPLIFLFRTKSVSFFSVEKKALMIPHMHLHKAEKGRKFLFVNRFLRVFAHYQKKHGLDILLRYPFYIILLCSTLTLLDFEIYFI